MRPRPAPLTGSGVVAVALALLLGWVALRAVNSWLLLVCCGILAPVLLSQVYRPDLRGLVVRVIGPQRSAVGESVRHVVRIANTGRVRTPPVLLRHRVAGFAEVTLPVPPLDPGAQVEVPVDRTARERCAPGGEALRLATSAPFGLATRRASVVATASAPVAVHPGAVTPWDVADLTSTQRLSSVGATAARSGDDSSGLRDWQRGDSRRQVHWRATARAGHLMVTARQEPVGLRLAVVLLDDDEHWLARAAWTAVAVVRSGGVVRLAAPGGTVLETGDADRVLDWSAAAETSGDATGLLDEARAWAGPDGVVLCR